MGKRGPKKIEAKCVTPYCDGTYYAHGKCRRCYMRDWDGQRRKQKDGSRRKAVLPPTRYGVEIDPVGPPHIDLTKILQQTFR